MTPSAAMPAVRRPAPAPSRHEVLIARLHRLWPEPEGLAGWLGTVDHKRIGIRYLVTAFAFLTAGGIEALLIRLQLIGPERAVLAPETYNQVFSLHGITMIFWYASPVLSGFGNYLIPLVIGSRDMAFPRMNALSYWIFLLSGVFFYVSVPLGQAPDAGWFAYVPLTEERYSPGLTLDFYALALLLLTISTTVGAVNFIVTILRLRAPGMALHRMPLLTYSTFTTAVLSLLALPALSACCIFLALDRGLGMRFFDTARGGDPLLWQHSFWFFGHPWVYIIFLPATGMISTLLPTYARRPVVGYAFIALSTVLTGVVGMGVWVHHMFAVGMSHMAMSFFAAASMTISIFSTVQVFAWVATLWLGRPVRTTSLLFVLGFIATFVIGGLSGVLGAVIPFDWQITDTYFIVAHLHYVLIGANLFPVLAALYHWFPKMTGRLLDERLGQWSFWLSFAGFNVGFFPMHMSGLLGMRRRVYTYTADDGFGLLNLITTIGAFVLAVGVLLTFVNVIVSRRRGRVAGRNPWNADTLEWATESPPKEWNFDRLPTVRTHNPLWDDHDEFDDPDDARALDGGRWTFASTRVDAEVAGVAEMPEDSLAPITLAVALTAVFAGLLGHWLWFAAVAAVACFVTVAAWLWPDPPKRLA